MKTKLSILGLVMLVVFGLVDIFSPPRDPISPLGNDPHPSYSIPYTPYIVLGFAPYWNLKKISPDSLGAITHFAYFTLHLKGNGELLTKLNPREEDPGYTNYKRLINNQFAFDQKPLFITFMPESQEALIDSISTIESRSKTTNTILDILAQSGAKGVNIDYEPLGSVSPEIRDSFTIFIENLHARLSPAGHDLTISIYASAASRPRLWDLDKLKKYVDHFVVMTYDYTLPGGTNSGPTSPLRGSGTLFEHDIIKNISEITKIIPSQKILLGIPFYGYEWDTIDESKYAPTNRRGSVASLERIQSLIDKGELEIRWDRNTLTPYGVSSDSGQVSQIYFENEVSIRLKLEFVKSAELGGIAIWALGYEGRDSLIWDTIKETLL